MIIGVIWCKEGRKRHFMRKETVIEKSYGRMSWRNTRMRMVLIRLEREKETSCWGCEGQMKDVFFLHLGERKWRAYMCAAENLSMENKLLYSVHAFIIPQCPILGQPQGRWAEPSSPHTLVPSSEDRITFWTSYKYILCTRKAGTSKEHLERNNLVIAFTYRGIERFILAFCI